MYFELLNLPIIQTKVKKRWPTKMTSIHVPYQAATRETAILIGLDLSTTASCGAVSVIGSANQSAVRHLILEVHQIGTWGNKTLCLVSVGLGNTLQPSRASFRG